MGILQRKNITTEYFSPGDSSSYKRLGTRILEMSRGGLYPHSSVVVVCIGTDRATGDSLGPIVGSLLKDSCCSYNVYGTLKDPVHALNLKEYINKIYTLHKYPYIIAVDASLGKAADIGKITLSSSPLFPGIGVNKKLPAIGDISITGIVNLSGKPGLGLLQSTRLYTVSNMAKCISDAIIFTCMHGT